jgi:hypothetical protein
MAEKELIEELWESVEANALTNRAAREIERLQDLLAATVNERNAAWLKLEDNGLETGHEVNLVE